MVREPSSEKERNSERKQRNKEEGRRRVVKKPPHYEGEGTLRLNTTIS